LPSLSRFTVATLAPVPTSLAFTIRISSDCAGFGHVGLIDFPGCHQDTGATCSDATGAILKAFIWRFRAGFPVLHQWKGI
jgi:hypothetical protein